MHICRVATSAALVAGLCLASAASHAACEAQSGARTAALVELYTSEGCSSCPPADRQLQRLRETLAPGALAVPLALHVSYWDAIGWKDPYAQAAFGERQRWLVQANGGRTSYTPQFFVGGGELRDWPQSLARTVQAVNATAAAADVRIAAALTPAGLLSVGAEAATRTAGDANTAQLYVAVTESGLVSRVLRGENGGATLGHDDVVRAWIGPIAFSGGKATLVRRELALPAAWHRDRLGVVAFVQDQRSGRVLQAVAAAQCARSS